MVVLRDRVDDYIGKRLQQRRRSLGLTQSQIAQLVGVRFQQTQKYECGGSRISASRIWRLAQALNVGVNYFYDGLPGDLAGTGEEGAGFQH
jgi:transcriptional regulator with XRE-family HTH domain